MNRVLLVDDDTVLADLLAQYMAHEGFTVEVAHDGSHGARLALSGAFDIVVLDVTLPRVDGMEALARIRQRSRLPVLMLTARGDDGDRIQGLELGADDYVPKPCTPRELTARLRSILRRTAPFDATVALSPVIVVDELSVWPQRREACCAGALLSLTGAEFNLLACMASRAGEVLGKGTLSRHALGRELNPQDRSIDVHICNLRHKLGLRADGQAWIANVRGQGYQLRST